MTEIPEHLRRRAEEARRRAAGEGTPARSIPEHLLERSRERLELAVKTTSVPDDRDDAYWNQFERTSGKADWSVEDRDTDECLYVSVQEHYVGRAPNLTTLGYMLCITLEPGNATDADVAIEMPVSGRELVRLGQQMLRVGLEIMGLG